MRLYRYVKAIEKNGKDTVVKQKLKSMLEESKLYFSHPASFNDPLECTIPIEINDYEKYKDKYRAFIDKILSKNIGSQDKPTDRNKRIYEAIEFGLPLENCLVACFTKRSNNQLMWAHYADQHQGICLCYEFPDSTEEWDEKIEWSDAVSDDIKNYEMNWIGNSVRYQNKRPSLKIADSSLPIEEWTFENNYIITDAFFVKPECWCYEQEWRLVLYLPFKCEIGFAAGINTSGYHAVIPREWLKEVTFGLRLDKNYCNEIADTINRSGYTGITYKRAKMAHGEFQITSDAFITDT